MTANVLRILDMIANPVSQRIGVAALRISIAIVFLWIGALKFVPYEADSITPFVANSPVMSFFYKHPEGYKVHLTREGSLSLRTVPGRQQTTPTRSQTDSARSRWRLGCSPSSASSRARGDSSVPRWRS